MKGQCSFKNYLYKVCVSRNQGGLWLDRIGYEVFLDSVNFDVSFEEIFSETVQHLPWL